MSVSGCTTCQAGGTEALQAYDRAYQARLGQESGQSPITLQAQLARYRKELSECVNCASSKTPEGKAQIEDLSGKIADLEARIDKVGDVKAADNQPTRSKSPLATAGVYLDVQA